MKRLLNPTILLVTLMMASGVSAATSQGAPSLLVSANPSLFGSVLNVELENNYLVCLQVYDVSGTFVIEFCDVQCNPEVSEFIIEGLDAGVYYCRMVAGNTTATQRFVVM